MEDNQLLGDTLPDSLIDIYEIEDFRNEILAPEKEIKKGSEVQ